MHLRIPISPYRANKNGYRSSSIVSLITHTFLASEPSSQVITYCIALKNTVSLWLLVRLVVEKLLVSLPIVKGCIVRDSFKNFRNTSFRVAGLLMAMSSHVRNLGEFQPPPLLLVLLMRLVAS